MITIGSSDAPTLVGVGFNTAQKLWRLKTKREERETLPEDKLELGNRIEGAAIAWLQTACRLSAISTQLGVDQAPERWELQPTRHGDTRLMVARPETLPFRAIPDFWDPEGIYIGEVKASHFPLKEEEPFECARRYWVQCQVQMLVCKVNQCILVHVHERVGGEWDIKVRRIGAHATFMRHIHDKALEFAGFVSQDTEVPRGWSRWPKELFDAP